jgi:hypothetical protein
MLNEVKKEVILGGKDAGLDYVYAFFMNCYHVYDWVLRSGYRSESDLGRLFANNPEMGLCRAVCNSAKHFVLRGGGITSTATQQAIYHGGSNRSRIQPIPGEHWVVVDDSGREHDMFTLADRCMSLWTEFLKPVP